MDIVKYKPISKLTLKQKGIRIIKFQLILASVLLNLLLAHQIYTVRCSVNYQNVGWFVKQNVCNDLAQDRMDSQELARLNRIKE